MLQKLNKISFLCFLCPDIFWNLSQVRQLSCTVHAIYAIRINEGIKKKLHNNIFLVLSSAQQMHLTSSVHLSHTGTCCNSYWELSCSILSYS